ncbi:MAG TPA: ribosome-associated translation inhibitor RaiA [Vicinamibacterales bacterium]|jgi:putative sigma-54 modulation protein|nr:ribosome-associated translation inhibitor RaiA [Vicinamibacterales bacterium]
MRLELTGRHLDVTPALRQLLERKLAKIDRLLHDSAVSAQVVCSIEKYRHVIEMTIHARGDHMLHGVGEGPNWPAALKMAGAKVEEQARRVKTKWTSRKRRATGRRNVELPVESSPAAVAAEVRPRVLRSRRYAVKPMTVEDAVLRVEAGGDTFVVFRNSSTDAINILYRRKDGHFGLIEPEA